MAKRMTKLKTSPSTLLAPGEGLAKVTQVFKAKNERQQAELAVANASEESKPAATQALALARLKEKHLKENRKAFH